MESGNFHSTSLWNAKVDKEDALAKKEGRLTFNERLKPGPFGIHSGEPGPGPDAAAPDWAKRAVIHNQQLTKELGMTTVKSRRLSNYAKKLSR